MTNIERIRAACERLRMRGDSVAPPHVKLAAAVAAIERYERLVQHLETSAYNLSGIDEARSEVARILDGEGGAG